MVMDSFHQVTSILFQGHVYNAVLSAALVMPPS